ARSQPADAFSAEPPHVALAVQRMWLPKLADALAAGDIDVAITCGLIPEPAAIVTEVFCAEPLLVGLRPGHRLANQKKVTLSDLAHDVLGAGTEALFPAWVLSQRQALDTAASTRPSST